MAYILHARPQPEELPRMVWMESTGLGDGLKMTVANALGTLATGFGYADELESLASGVATCVCSGEIWLERTSEAHLWNVSIIHAAHLGDIAISSFEFACAIQRIQLERLNLLGAPEIGITGESAFDDEMRARRALNVPRAFACDS